MFITTHNENTKECKQNNELSFMILTMELYTFEKKYLTPSYFIIIITISPIISYTIWVSLVSCDQQAISNVIGSVVATSGSVT